MSADQRGGGFGAALDRLGAELSERRTPLAMVLAALALLMTYRGLHQPTHSYAAVGVAMLLVARAVALGRAFLGRHLDGSVALLVAAHTADTGEHALVAWTAVAAGGAVAGLPRPPPAAPPWPPGRRLRQPERSRDPPAGHRRPPTSTTGVTCGRWSTTPRATPSRRSSCARTRAMCSAPTDRRRSPSASGWARR